MFEQAFRNIDDVLRKEAGCTTELDYTEQTSWLLFLKYLDGLEEDKSTEAEFQGRKYDYILSKKYPWESWAAPKGKDGKLDHQKAKLGPDLIEFVNDELFPYLQGFKQKAASPNTIEYKMARSSARSRTAFHECHRGGANDESTWSDILEYFSPAVQLGLTATPKRKDNIDTYRYFGEPVYVYSLKEGINDGFLTPFKVKQIATTLVTSFWHPDGTPMSAQQFLEMLFGKLPEFFKDEDGLRRLWSSPDTRFKLLQGLAEKGFGGEQLAAMARIIDAEKSDLYDVLAHVAYALPPQTREERAARAKIAISKHFDNRQQAFLEFVLAHYVSEGVRELDQDKLTPLLRLRYHNAIADAVVDLGKPEQISKVFAGFQKYLYVPADV